MARGTNILVLALSICLAAETARAEALRALVAREGGVDFGACALRPTPALAGKVHAVIPARFETPGVWVTRTILLVGVDDANTVHGTLELKVADDLPPREVISVTCNGDRLAIRLKHKTFSYTFDGKALRRSSGRGK